MLTDEDIAAGLGQLADRLHTRSSDTTDDLEVQKQQSSLVYVTLPSELKPSVTESQFVTSSSAPSQTPLITDWQSLVSQLQAGTRPIVSDPTTQAVSPLMLTGTNCNVGSAPLVKKVIRLVVSRPSASNVGQSQTCTNIVGSCLKSTANMTSSYSVSVLNNTMLSSAGEAVQLTTLPSDFSNQKLVVVQADQIM